MEKLSLDQALKVRANFVNFATREGLLTAQQATEELGNLFASPLRIRLEDSYLTMSRIGSSFTLNRAQRKKIYMIFANAVNHATF